MGKSETTATVSLPNITHLPSYTLPSFRTSTTAPILPCSKPYSGRPAVRTTLSNAWIRSASILTTSRSALLSHRNAAVKPFAGHSPVPSQELDCDQNMIGHPRVSITNATPLVLQTTRGEIPSGLPPKARGAEPRGSTAWEHHHPKAEVVVRIVRGEPAAIGTPHTRMVDAEPAAPQHTGCTSIRL